MSTQKDIPVNIPSPNFGDPYVEIAKASINTDATGKVRVYFEITDPDVVEFINEPGAKITAINIAAIGGTYGSTLR